MKFAFPKIPRSVVIKLIILILILFSPEIFGQIDTIQLDKINVETKEIKKKERKEKRESDKEYVKGRRFRIGTSFIFGHYKTVTRIESPNGLLGVSLGFEELLGFDDTGVIPKFEFQYSFNRKSAIYAEFFRISRDSRLDVFEGFDWGDIEIPDDAGIVDLYFDTQIWSIGYMYSFINKPHAELSFFANVFVLGVKTGIDYKAENLKDDLDFTAPLPSFGYKFSYEILKRTRFGGSHSFFFLRIGDYSGTIQSFCLFLDYEIKKWVRLGLAYNDFALNITTEADNYRGIIEYGYKGAGLKMMFIF